METLTAKTDCGEDIVIGNLDPVGFGRFLPSDGCRRIDSAVAFDQLKESVRAITETPFADIYFEVLYCIRGYRMELSYDVGFSESVCIFSDSVKLKDDNSLLFKEVLDRVDGRTNLNLREKIIRYVKKTKTGLYIEGFFVGPGILGNRSGLFEKEFFVKNIYNYKNGEWYDWFYVNTFCTSMNIQSLPKIIYSRAGGLFDSYDLLMDFCKKNCPSHSTGVIFKSVNNKIVFEVKNGKD